MAQRSSNTLPSRTSSFTPGSSVGRGRLSNGAKKTVIGPLPKIKPWVGGIKDNGATEHTKVFVGAPIYSRVSMFR